MLAARADGIEMVTFTSGGSGIVKAVVVLIQLASVAIVSFLHLTSDFAAAWKPALLLIVGVVLLAFGVVLLR